MHIVEILRIEAIPSSYFYINYLMQNILFFRYKV